MNRWRINMSAAAAVFILLCGAARAADEQPSEPVNLLPNGDFTQVDETSGWPIGWTSKHEKNVKWMTDAVHGRAAEMSGDKNLMGTYGVDVYSDKIEIKPGHRYRVTGWTRSDGPNQIVFVKGYGTVTKKIDGKAQQIDDIIYQMKKEIEPHKQWTPFSLEFEVKPAKIFTAHQSEVKYVRVLLWAYWPVGTCWYADVKFFDVTTPAEVENNTAKHANIFTGEKPQLSEEAEKADEPAFDAQQAWMDAANAWAAGEYAKCEAACKQLIKHEPAHVNAHLMAARALVELQRWDDAAAMVKWLQAQPAEKLADWQRDYLQITRTQLLLHKGKKDEAKALLQAVIAHSESIGAVAAAKAVLEKIEKAEE